MFIQTIHQVLKLFLFLLIGYILVRKDILPEGTPKVLSRLLVWVCCPAIGLKTFISEFHPDKLKGAAALMGISTALLAVLFLLSHGIARMITHDGYTRNVIVYSLCIPNTGYIGNVLVLAILGEKLLLDFQILTLPLSIFAVSIGYHLLLEKEYNLRNLFNPLMTFTLIGIVLGLCRVRLPAVILETLDGAADCIGPVSMILTGCVIAGFDLKRILTMKEVYLTIFVKMVLLPMVVVIAGRLFFHTHGEYFILILILESLPAGLNSVILPSTTGRDCSFGAGMALISTVIGIVTIPLFFNMF